MSGSSVRLHSAHYQTTEEPTGNGAKVCRSKSEEILGLEPMEISGALHPVEVKIFANAVKNSRTHIHTGGALVFSATVT